MENYEMENTYVYTYTENMHKHEKIKKYRKF